MIDCSTARTMGCSSAARRDAFDAWEDRASVRNAPRRVLGAIRDDETLFPADYAPVCAHPLVAGKYRAKIGTLLAFHLYRYLTFTVNLELKVVNRSTRKIIDGTLPIRLSQSDHLGALKLYCDEGYHALFSADLLKQASDVSGIRVPSQKEPVFLRRLRAYTDDPGTRELLELLFTIVSETLITSNLTDVHAAPGTPDAVRDVIRDHALDEARHHYFYKQILFELWGGLDATQRRLAARALPAFVMFFVEPDRDSIVSEMELVGITACEAEQVYRETYDDKTVSDYGCRSATQMIRYARELDAMDFAGVTDGFAARGLL